MRNLKKVLSLVLALMMVLSVMVTANAASFEDIEDSKYQEAIEVMAAAGVLNGKGDGFAPEATLKRGEAAKILAYIELGSDISLIEKTNTVFTDVTAAHWASGYINYVYAQGYINGNGDGTFAPNGELNGYAFAKMLLNVMGIEGEYANNANWKLNIAKAYKNAGLNKGLESVALSSILTREQAAQMAFNAMKKNLVGNDEIIYVVGNREFTSAADAKAYAEITKQEISVKEDVTGSLLYNNFGIFAGVAANYDDAYGRPAKTVWLTKDAKGKDVAVYVEMEEAIAKFNSNVNNKTLAAALGVKEDVVKDNGLNVTGNGKVVEYYANTTIEIDYTVATVTVSTDEKTGDVYYIVDETSFVDYKDDTKNTDTVAVHGEIVDGAIVTYEAQTGVCNIYPTTVFEGNVSRKGTALVTIEGKPYAISAAKNALALSNSAYTPSTTDKLFVLDQFGYLVGTTTAKVEAPAEVIPTQFVYVLQYQTRAYKAGATVGGDLLTGGTTTEAVAAAAKAQVVFTDGSVAVVDLEIYKAADKKTDMVDLPVAGKITAGTLATTEGPVAVGTWFGYEVNEDGTFSLVDLNAKTAQVVTDKKILANQTATIAGKYLNSLTSITSITYTEKDGVKVNTVTGMQAVDVTLGSVLVVYGEKATHVSAIYGYNGIEFGKPSETPAPVVPVYHYLAGAGEQVIGGYEYDFYVEGALKADVVISSGIVEGAVLYTLTADLDKDGKATGTYTATAVEGLTTVEKVVMADSTFFVTSGAHYYSKYGCDVYNVAKDGNGAADVIEAGDYVVYLTDAYGVALVYIVDAPKEA